MKKNQKPIELDASFCYRCPKKSCGYQQWFSLKEVQTKNFKIVCDCGCVYQPKQVSKLKICYAKEKIKQPVQMTITPPVISDTLLNSCVQKLVSYGFTELESEKMIRDEYARMPETNVASLVKNALNSVKNTL